MLAPDPAAPRRAVPRVAIVVALVLLGVALRARALAVGFGMDDWAQLAMLAGEYPVARAPWDLFSFCDGSPAEVQRLVAAGSLPWWSDPQLQLSTLRPLASLSTWLDVRWFGEDPWPHHLHTLLWWVVMLAAVARLLLRVLPARWALLAFALYVLDECHAQPLAWLANRNAIMATTFVAVAVHAHVHWREGGGARWAAGAAGALALALGCGEYGLGGLALVLAYELTHGAGRTAVRGLLPHAPVVLLWAGVHRWLGYGSHGSAIYVDPLREPWAWLQAAAERAPVLLADLAFAVPTGRVAFSPSGLRWQAFAGVLALLGTALWLRRTAPGRDPAQRASLRWFAVAAVLSVLPVVSAFVSARLLLVPAIAAHGLVAACLLDAFDARARGGWRARGGRAVAAALVVAHVGLAPWWGIAEIRDVDRFGAAARTAAIAAPIDDVSRVVVIAAADPATLLYPPLVRRAAGMTRPAAWSVLSMAPGPHRLHRVDAHTLELTVERGAMLRGAVEQLFRRADRLPRVGEPLTMGDVEIVVRAVDAEGFPVRVSFRFAQPLDAPSVRWLLATPGGFVAYPLGPVGASMPVPPAAAPGG